MASKQGESSSLRFEKRRRDPANISGEWRLATVAEVNHNLQAIKRERILDSWDIARLLDGWVDGPDYGYNIRSEYKPHMGHMIVVKTNISRPPNNSFCEEMYSEISLARQGRKAALLLSTDDKIVEVLVWVLRNVENQAELDGLRKSMEETFGSYGITKLHYWLGKAMPEGVRLKLSGDDQPSEADSLGRIHFAEGLAELFLNPLVKTPVTVGIFGDWGMGKSSLMVQTEIALLKTAAQLAFPNLLQTEFLGFRSLELSKHGQRNYEKIRKAVKHLFLQYPDDDPLVHFLENYQQRYHDLYRSLAVMDRNEMFHVIGTNAHDLGKIPSILTVQYNAWHYQTELEAWAGLAVEITKVIEETMNMAQTIRTHCRYAWKEQRRNICLDLVLPCLFMSFIAGWIAWAAWLLISRSNGLVELKYGSIPVTVVAIVWGVLGRLFSVLKPISDQIKAYVRLPDHSGNLGYQQKVIADIKFLKAQIGEKPSWFWKFTAGQWCWNWFGLYSDTVNGTGIRKLPPASMDNLRIIVFVDDLDRCRDTVILQVLSAINLVLAACEINVILGMDKKMIAKAIAKTFEHKETEAEDAVDLANKYISKIVQLPLTLPDPSEAETKNFLEQLLDEDIHLDADAEEEEAGQPQYTPVAVVALNVSQIEGERPTQLFSSFWSKVSRLLEACGAFRNYLAQSQQSNGTTETSFKRLQGTPLISFYRMSNYSAGEREALSYLRTVTTGVQRLPREWKRFLTYHRLAWNILSRSGQLKSLPGRQVELLVWIFCCWQWRERMNTIIKKWVEVVCMYDKSLLEGPSLLKIVDQCIEMENNEKEFDTKQQIEVING